MGITFDFSLMHFDDISNFVSTVNRTIERAESDLTRRIQERAERMIEEERTELYNDHADEELILMASSKFINRSMLIAAYAHFEDSLKRTCMDAYGVGLSRRPVQPMGFHMKNARDYLEALSGGTESFDINALGSNWTEIYDGWRLVRNNLAHGNGVVECEMASLNDDGSPGDPQVVRSPYAEEIEVFVRSRRDRDPSDLSVKCGNLEVESEAVEAFLRTAQGAIEDTETEVERITPPSVAPHSLRAR